MTETLPTRNTALIEEFGRRLREARLTLFLSLAVRHEEISTLEAHQAGAVGKDAATETVAVILSRLEGREKHELDEIEDALTRLEAGSFGLCECCGRAISLARLRAMPAARTCIGCQQKAETR